MRSGDLENSMYKKGNHNSVVLYFDVRLSFIKLGVISRHYFKVC